MQNKAFKKALQVQEVLVLTLLLIYDDPLGHTFLRIILTVGMALITLFLPFPVNNKLEVKVGSWGWRKAVRRTYSDSNKKGCQMRQKSANSMAGYHWGNWAKSVEEPSVLCLTTAYASTMFSINMSVKKKAWLTEVMWYKGRTEAEGMLCQFPKKFPCVIVVHCNDPESPPKKVGLIIH